MHGHVGAAFGVYPGELGKCACFGVFVELVDWEDVCFSFSGFGCPFVEEGIWEETLWADVCGVLVVYPGYVVFCELFEDGFLGELGGVVGVVIGSMACVLLCLV